MNDASIAIGSGAPGGAGIMALRGQVVAIVEQLAPEPLTSSIADADTFVEGLGYHSLALVELSFAIEEAFDLEPLTAEDVEDIRTFGDLVEFLSHRVS